MPFLIYLLFVFLYLFYCLCKNYSFIKHVKHDNNLSFNMGFGSVPQCALHTICCMIAISVMTPPCAVIGVINCLSFHIIIGLGTKRLGYEMTWIRNDLGTKRLGSNILGTKRLGYVRNDLFPYSLTQVVSAVTLHN